jgi:hypothetical protein
MSTDTEVTEQLRTALEPPDILELAIDHLVGRLALCRTKGDTNNRPELREKSMALINRCYNLLIELHDVKPGGEYQAIQRSVTEIIEDCNSLERSAGTSAR